MFRGTIIFISPEFFVPLLNAEQVDGTNYLMDRAHRSVFMTIGHLKPGVSLAAATADLNSIAAYLQKTYPKEEKPGGFALGRPNLLGDQFAPGVKAFIAGLMLLAGLILLAACANLGSLFAARSADRVKEIAVRLALGSSHNRILRALFTEAVMISLSGGAAGMWASAAFLHWLSDWQPFGNFPVHIPVNPDATVYALALLLSVIAGFLFGAVPVGQVLRADTYQVIKLGSSAGVGKKITARDVLLGVQIALCAVLITSSLVAVRGLINAMHGDFGFEPHNSMLVGADLHMAGYSSDRVPAMQKRMLDALSGIPGVESVGLSNELLLNDQSTSSIFSDKTTDLRPTNAALASVYTYSISPEYLHAERTSLLAGRAFTWHDDKASPRVATAVRPRTGGRGGVGIRARSGRPAARLVSGVAASRPTPALSWFDLRRCPAETDGRWDRRRRRTRRRSRPTAGAGRTRPRARPSAPRTPTPAPPRCGRAG